MVEEWIVVRRGWLVRGFLDALTIGGPGGAPRPIELQAHDPLRYVGDMLAWVHQALPSEREAAQTLFAKCSNIGKGDDCFDKQFRCLFVSGNSGVCLMCHLILSKSLANAKSSMHLFLYSYTLFA